MKRINPTRNSVIPSKRTGNLLLRAQHLQRTFPLLVKSLYLGEETPKNLAKMYNIPLEWTQSISSAIGSIAFSKIKVQEMEEPGLLPVAGAFAKRGFETTSYEKLLTAAS